MSHEGRIRRYTEEDEEEIADKFVDYFRSTEVPILAEFCWMNEVPRDLFYNKHYPILVELRKVCMMKKEAQLERLSSIGQWDTRMAIFALRQLGWKDKQEITHDGKIDSQVKIYLPNNKRMLNEEDND